MAQGLFDLAGRRAVVTGGARGIGLAIARGLADHGAEVILCGRHADTLAEAATSIGPQAQWLVMDVAEEAAVQEVATALRLQGGRVDILVNNAGINPHYADILDTGVQEWEQILRTNLHGVYHCCRHLGRLVLEGGGGSIINISSVGGSSGLRKQVPYCAAKGGVEQLTRTLALDWAPRGVRVNAIGYGFIATDLTAAMVDHPHIAPRLKARTPMGRFGEVSEVAAAAVFLASPGASYVTGHTLMVDGGWSAG
jgi:gluconate 5-dehydrogenase